MRTQYTVSIFLLAIGLGGSTAAKVPDNSSGLRYQAPKERSEHFENLRKQHKRWVPVSSPEWTLSPTASVQTLRGTLVEIIDSRLMIGRQVSAEQHQALIQAGYPVREDLDPGGGDCLIGDRFIRGFALSMEARSRETPIQNWVGKEVVISLKPNHHQRLLITEVRQVHSGE